MAIIKRENGSYQVRIVGLDGRIVSATFRTRKEAEGQELNWKQAKRCGKLGTNSDRKISVRDYFAEWFADVKAETPEHEQSGWRDGQKQLFRDYIDPVLGAYPLHAVRPLLVKRVLIEMAKKGRSPTTQRLCYATMKKTFGDAVEIYEYTALNPVLKKLRPEAAVKEAQHLNLKQIVSLLQYVRGKKYGLAIWVQLYLGLRAGELTALRWEDIDLTTGRITIRRTFVKKTGKFREYPKGGKQHSHSIPIELLHMLIEAHNKAVSEFVVTWPLGGHLPYRWYLVALKKYCQALAIPLIASHGLRHSTSELYIHHGATRDDLQSLFAHSSREVTDRYVHDRGTHLEKVAGVIRLFPERNYPKTTHNRHPFEN